MTETLRRSRSFGKPKAGSIPLALADQGLFPALRWSWVRSCLRTLMRTVRSANRPVRATSVVGPAQDLEPLDMSDLDRWELINDRWGLNYSFDRPIVWLEPPFKRETSKAVRAHYTRQPQQNRGVQRFQTLRQSRVCKRLRSRRSDMGYKLPCPARCPAGNVKPICWFDSDWRRFAQ